MIGTPPTEADLAALRRSSWLTEELVAKAGIRRLDEETARQVIGISGNRSGCYAGLGFPYGRPGESTINEWRVRRDNPNYEQQSDGSMKERAKYLGPPGRGNRFYFVPETPIGNLTDMSLPVVFAEGEKKALALARLAEYESERPRWLPIGLAGVWSWRGTVGKAAGPDGERRDVKGPLPDFDLLLWQDREAIIVFDNDTHTNPKVRAARQEPARELRGAWREGAASRSPNIHRENRN